MDLDPRSNSTPDDIHNDDSEGGEEEDEDYQWLSNLTEDEMKEEYKKLDQEKERLADQCEQLMSEAGKAEQTGQSNHIKIMDLTSQVRDLNAAVTRLQQKKDMLVTQKKEAEEEITVLKSSLSSLLRSHDDIKKTNDTLTTVARDSKQSIQLFTRRFVDTMDSIVALNAPEGSAPISVSKLFPPSRRDDAAGPSVQCDHVSSSPKKATGGKKRVDTRAGEDQDDEPTIKWQRVETRTDDAKHVHLLCPVAGCKKWNRYACFRDYSHWRQHVPKGVDNKEFQYEFVCKLDDAKRGHDE